MGSACSSDLTVLIAIGVTYQARQPILIEQFHLYRVFIFAAGGIITVRSELF
jgi:hypothetical protein